MTSLVAAIDQGTTSTRCILFDSDSRARGSAQEEHRQVLPRAGWVEHDALEIWERTRSVVRGALADAGCRPADVTAVGVTNQRETVVIWNRETCVPYLNAIVWQDTRTKQLCESLAEDGGFDRFRERTGLPLATYFSGPKIAWALEHVEGLREEAERGRAICGTIDAWIIWNLTGGAAGGSHVTDVTNASRTQLMDLSTLDWCDEILELLRIPRGMLPRIVPSSDAAGWGTTSPDGPFAARIPVCGAVGDQQAALLGQCCFEVGDAKNTYGTGCFMLLNTGAGPTLSRAGLLTTLAYQFAGQAPVYALEGSIAIAGALVQWLRDNLGLISEASEIEGLARSVEDSAGIYIVPAFSGLFAPHWRADARGVIVGLTRFVNKGHIARAALEAVCHQTCDVLEAMRRDSGLELSSLKVDGGMVANDLLMQLQADLLGAPVSRPSLAETTALGAAYAAGLARDFFPAPSDLRAAWSPDRTWEPGLDETSRQRLRAGWSKALERSFDWV